MALFQPFRYVKAYPTAKQRGERAHFHSHTCRSEIDGNTAVLPETDITGYQSIVWRIDEKLVTDRAFLRIKRAGFNRAHAISTEQHRVTRTQLTCFFTVQDHADPFRIWRCQRRRIQQLVIFQLAAFITGLQLNICPGQQRAQATDTFTPHLRLHHPKNRIFMQQLFHTGIEACFNFHMGQIIRQGSAFNHADIHTTAFNRRFTPFNTLSIGRNQRDFRPLMAVVVKQNPCANECGDDREYPHGRPVFYLLHFGFPTFRFHAVRTPHGLVLVHGPTTDVDQTSSQKTLS